MSDVRSGTVPRVAAKARLEWDEVRQRHVLLYPEGLVALNATAAEVLRLCDGERAIAQILETLKQRYKSDQIDSEVAALLNALAAKGLVTYVR
ncbi:MAG TPA: pyrroloquinoline quinone biosynthesis peptide chaperone PqqD [Gemmatimonadales bacterium]|nr:pyrroloquinoline quinone biosynthesis peptide chaperone PqqD [Gemmatimonadales bacterium]